MCVWHISLLIVAVYAIWKLVRKHWMLGNIHDRPVFITGCDSGFGELLALDLYEKGVTVFAGCLTEDAVAKYQTSYGSRMKPILLDVTDSESICAAVEYVSGQLGDKALWGVVNNAGIGGPVAPFEWTTKDDCQRTLEVNLLGTYDVMLKFLPLLRRGKRGRIVNMASAMGRFALASSCYSISKYGVESISEGLSYELEPFNISVHILEPGAFKTRIISLESQMENMSKIAQQTRNEVKEVYGGGQFLRKFIEHNSKSMESIASTDTHLVVEAYEHALFAKYPQTRYQVGFNANWLWIPFSLLPLGFQKCLVKTLAKLFGGELPRPNTAS